ncbi:GDSL-like Lipase/Acylhydrolase family protein [Amycolatopsis xylanica]|uniref:GDSL-like Lipase/Acylhydrolase family protein n=1 Tax=Amycolatopsis xylanica TaxID=589385 RepID=A0A1H3E1T1_9PSEU|nr:SGNH/GDSL hydrolase family protein [Amycolatopsis xylanica]SDX72631.1 GDSL-like Lipase/Acylhydrolase family protein [Amycolatopsis xylanica]
MAIRTLIAAFLLIIGLAAPAAAADAYFALGDSYSSGLGAGKYGTSGKCKRSVNAYPQLWVNEHAGTKLTFLACSGATTADVLTQAGSITPDATLVTLSVGGTDAGFSDVMVTCVLNSEQACAKRVDVARKFITETLPGRLDAVLAKIKAAAPNARVFLLGYPHLFADDGSCGFSIGMRKAINAGADTMAAVEAERASAAGVTFVDVRAAFTGHNVCAAGSQYLHGIASPLEESFHPTKAGQFGYFRALAMVTDG